MPLKYLLFIAGLLAVAGADRSATLREAWGKVKATVARQSAPPNLWLRRQHPEAWPQDVRAGLAFTGKR